MECGTVVTKMCCTEFKICHVVSCCLETWIWASSVSARRMRCNSPPSMTCMQSSTTMAGWSEATTQPTLDFPVTRTASGVMLVSGDSYFFLIYGFSLFIEWCVFVHILSIFWDCTQFPGLWFCFYINSILQAGACLMTALWQWWKKARWSHAMPMSSSTAAGTLLWRDHRVSSGLWELSRPQLQVPPPARWGGHNFNLLQGNMVRISQSSLVQIELFLKCLCYCLYWIIGKAQKAITKHDLTYWGLHM